MATDGVGWGWKEVRGGDAPVAFITLEFELGPRPRRRGGGGGNPLVPGLVPAVGVPPPPPAAAAAAAAAAANLARWCNNRCWALIAFAVAVGVPPLPGVLGNDVPGVMEDPGLEPNGGGGGKGGRRGPMPYPRVEGGR